MYKWRTDWEKDHERWEWVEEDEQCEKCGHTNNECECSDTIEDNRDEYSTRDQPIAKSFYDRYGFDERDGPPAEEEERGDVGDPDVPMDDGR